MAIEIRGVEVTFEATDKIVRSIVRVDDSAALESRELYRNKPVNRGQIQNALIALYGVGPAQIVWPKHIKLDLS